MTRTTAIAIQTRLFFVFLLLWQATSVVLAGPGAHGPGGEHLDQTGAAPAAAAAQTRFEAATDTFELLAVLGGGELSLLIDRFETNVPVLNARVVVEAAGLRAEARFHQDHGDYAIDDPAFIAAVSRPGEHAVVITVVAGEDSDLLNGTLIVAAQKAVSTSPHSGAAAHDHDHTLGRAATAGGLLAGLGVAIYLVRRRRNVTASTATGALR